MYALTSRWSAVILCAVALAVPYAQANAAVRHSAKTHSTTHSAHAGAGVRSHARGAAKKADVRPAKGARGRAAVRDVAASGGAKTDKRGSAKHTMTRAERLAAEREIEREMERASSREGSRKMNRAALRRAMAAERRHGLSGFRGTAQLKRASYRVANAPSVAMYPNVPEDAHVAAKTAVRDMTPAVIATKPVVPDVSTAAAGGLPTPGILRIPDEMPAPLRGSHESLVRQNVKTEAEGLERIEDDGDLNDRIARHQLVTLPETAVLHVNPSLPENRRYCRPWTASFLSDIARAHAAVFHGGFVQVNSAVRTIEYQRRLGRTNGNAAPAEGDVASPHLTGATVDIAKQGLSRQEIAWMRAYLGPLQAAGKIDVEEEFMQACFHVTVYTTYVGDVPAAGKHRAVAANGGGTNVSAR